MTDTKNFVPRTHENGGPCCTSPGNLCAQCQAHFAAPPNPYTQGIAALRAAEAAPEDAVARFAADYKLNRLIALNAEYHDIAEADARAAEAAERLGVPQHELRFASGDGATSYAPPDPYSAALKALRENGR